MVANGNVNEQQTGNAGPASDRSEEAAARLLADLNPRQMEAATHVSGPLLIVAGPGSGKTRVMAHRVAYLIQHEGVAPWRVLAVTFTNKAARELRERCEWLVYGRIVSSDAPARASSALSALQVFTFHGFSARVLRQDGERAGLKPGFSIYDDDDQARIVKRILEELDIDTKQTSPAGVLRVISDAKNHMLGPEQFAKNAVTYREEVVGRIYVKYEAALARANACDFDDLLLKTFRLFQDAPDVLARYQERYLHLLVDEFQDTNPLQFQVARLLAAKHKNICVVGDPDQSIYSWRHADPTNLHEFLKVYPTARVVTLDQSYRSTQTIISAADSVISNNPGRLEKSLWTENPRGTQIAAAEAYDEDEEARMVLDEVERLVQQEGIPAQEIAVMYRINAQSRAMEVACNRRGMPYRLVGGQKFYERAEIKDVLSYLRVVSNPADDVALERIINVPARGISENTVAELRRAAQASEVTLLDAVFSVQEELNLLGVNLSARAANAVSSFADLMKRLIDQSLTLQPTELIDLLLERSGYLRLLHDDEAGLERVENVRELRGTAEQFIEDRPETDTREALAAFLENVALVSDVDTMDRPIGAHGENQAIPKAAGGRPITLITLHQAKGLEFDAVFMVGLEEGLLPHSRSFDDPVQLQEERRLCYVGMTRARKRLYLFHAFQRYVRGSRMASIPSRFLMEIPQQLVSFRSIRNTGRRGGVIRDPVTIKRAATIPAPRDASAPKLEYSVGDRVSHSVFGDGVIVSVKQDRGDAEVTVAFSGKGVKRLLASMARLEKVRHG